MEKVTSRATGKVYARKRINRSKTFGADTRSQKIYENELRTLNKVVDHEHLIKVKGTYTDKKWMVMLLQPVADENLKEYMSRRTELSVRQQASFRRYFGCLANTIRFLHDPSIEILHKDIKPENVLLKDGQVILTDFGTAFDWSKTGQSMTRSNAGDSRTPRYQSPEAALGEFHRSSDIWSLGVLFLEMVTFLRGKTLAEMDIFLQRHGQGVTSIHNNIEGAMNWFEQLQANESGSPIDNEPLTWIKAMLNRVQTNRPTAVELFDNIVGFQDGRFCGSCCADIESSSDGVGESDMDMLSDVLEQEEPNVQSNNSDGASVPIPTDRQMPPASERNSHIQNRADDTTSSPFLVDPPPSSYLYGEVPAGLISPRQEISQVPAKSMKSTKEISLMSSQRVLTKPRAGAFRERDTFIQWLASLPQKFTPKATQQRSFPTKRSTNPRSRGPSVETQRIRHFLSSLPEEVAEFDDPPEGLDDLATSIEPYNSVNRSRTMPVDSRGVKRSNSQDDFQSSSHRLHEENDEEQFADVGKSRLVHYASDGDLDMASAITREALQNAKKDLKDFAATLRLKNCKQAIEIGETSASYQQTGERLAQEEDQSLATVDQTRPLVITDMTSSLEDVIARTSQGTYFQPATGEQGNTDLNKEATSTVGTNPSKSSATTRAPTLGAFIRKAPSRRRRQFESASVIMDRILDDKSSEAPTSVMSANTRAAVSGGRIGLRWNDKAYGYLPKFVANGKVGAVRECLNAGCNPGTPQKPRWAPIYNAVRGATDKHLKCLRELVFYGADVNAERSMNGRTLLHYAVESEEWSGYSSVIYTLLAWGANPNVRDGANDLPLLMLLVGNGPLSRAKRDALFLLLAPNFSTNLNVRVPGTLDNSLHLAIRRKDPYTVDAILEKMKQVGGPALDLMHEHNGSGFTPILLALTIFQLGEEADEEVHIFRCLLQRGASANDVDISQQKTPLHLVIGGCKNSIVLELLCRHSANPELPDLSGQTPMALVRKLRADYPRDSWYQFADRRMGNRLTAEDYCPPELETFLVEEASDGPRTR